MPGRSCTARPFENQSPMVLHIGLQNKEENTMYGILVLSVYAIIMFGVTVFLTKRETVAERFHVGDRNMGTLQSAMSIAATWIWAPALFVSAEKAYANGFVGLFWFLVPNVLCLLLFIPFAKRIRERMPKGISLAGFMGKEYKSEKVQGIYLFQLGALAILSTGVQLLAGGKILSTITGIPMLPMTIILAVIAYSYSQFSGIRASVLTDAVQMTIMLAVCAVLVPWALSMPGNIQSLQQGVFGVSGDYVNLFDENGMKVLFGFGIPTAIGLFAGPFGDQCFWQRAFSIKESKIRRAFSLGALLFAIVPLSMGVLGFVAAGNGYIPNDLSIVNFELVSNTFPKWVMVPFLFMVVSGLLSTVDSNLCAISSLTAEMKCVSSLQSNAAKLKAAKWSMLAILAVGILIANIPGMTVTHLFLFYGTLRSATLLPTVFTLTSVKTSAKGVYVGIVLSLCCGLPLFAYGNILGIAKYKTLGSLLTVLMAGVASCIITKVEGKERG